MQTVEVNGRELHYVEEGQGQPLVFVHGGLNDYRAWTLQMEPFAKRYRVVAYSRRYAYPNRWMGDGTDSSVADNAADLETLIDKLGLAPAHLVGHSWGGFIAILCALHHPERVRTLVLGEPAIVPLLLKNPQHPNPLRILSLFLRRHATGHALMRFATKTIRPAEEAVRRGDSEEAMRIFVDGVLGRKDALSQLPPPVRAMFADNVESIRGELTGGLGNFSRKDALRISTPTLLVKGEQSPRWLRAIVEILARSMPNNEQAEIPGASHGLQFENPDAFNERVLAFLAKHP